LPLAAAAFTGVLGRNGATSPRPASTIFFAAATHASAPPAACEDPVSESVPHAVRRARPRTEERAHATVFFTASLFVGYRDAALLSHEEKRRARETRGGESFHGPCNDRIGDYVNMTHDTLSNPY
jgi:hypothetical protein